MVSGEGGFHEMYTEVEDVLCAVVGIGLPVGAVSKARRETREEEEEEGEGIYQYECWKV